MWLNSEFGAAYKYPNTTRLNLSNRLRCDFVMAVYNIDENVLLLAMHTCFMSHLLVLVLILVSRELILVLVLVLNVKTDLYSAIKSEDSEACYSWSWLQHRLYMTSTCICACVCVWNLWTAYVLLLQLSRATMFLNNCCCCSSFF